MGSYKMNQIKMKMSSCRFPSFSRCMLLIFISLPGKLEVVNSSHDEEQPQLQKRSGSPLPRVLPRRPWCQRTSASLPASIVPFRECLPFKYIYSRALLHDGRNLIVRWIEKQRHPTDSLNQPLGLYVAEGIHLGRESNLRVRAA